MEPHMPPRWRLFAINMSLLRSWRIPTGFRHSARGCEREAGGLAAISRWWRSLRRHHRNQTSKTQSIPEGCQPLNNPNEPD
jgi:hypothetical protein